MRSNSRILHSVLVAAFVAGIATVSFAQSGRSRYGEPLLRGNPYRDAGGSCVYDKKGRVVFAPNGKHCADESDHLSKSRSDSPIVDAFPPALRPELTKLLADHEHLADEMARLRRAVDRRNRPAALEAVEKVRSELMDHRSREEQFFTKLARHRTTP